MSANRVRLTHKGCEEFVELSLHDGDTGYLWVKNGSTDGPVGVPLNSLDIDQLRITLNRHHRQRQRERGAK
jgi:hypothetical protein